MPIRKELKHFYGPQWIKETRPAALERAGHRCQDCGKADRSNVETVTCVEGDAFNKSYVMYWRPFPVEHLPLGCWRAQDGTPLYFAECHRYRPTRFVWVVLTVAHLNNVAGDDRPENLRALCQWCHLIYDLVHHHRTRAYRKDQDRPILAMLDVRDAGESTRPSS
jgi:hypothetical protein